MNSRPIGVFDSGVGGLSILRSVREALPGENLLYLADQAHVPYGPRSAQEVLAFSIAITEFLLQQGAKAIVIACNTASAAALHPLRRQFPHTPFIGMEPAVKPAAGNTRSGVVGVLATPATFQGALYASVVERFAEGVTILKATLPGLVELIERGVVDGPQVEAILRQAVEPMTAQNADTLVLACTHYPFVIPTLRKIAGPSVSVIDPAPAIARQTARILDRFDLHNSQPVSGEETYFTSGDPDAFRALIRQLRGVEGAVRRVEWRGRSLSLAAPP